MNIFLIIINLEELMKKRKRKEFSTNAGAANLLLISFFMLSTVSIQDPADILRHQDQNVKQI